MTSSSTSATPNLPSSSMSISATTSGCASRHDSRSRGCSATSASSRAATAGAAATCAACPWVQMTARICRSPTAESTASASRPGSTTMTSSSSPTIQTLLSGSPASPGDVTRSIRASMAGLPFSSLFHERPDGLRHELDRDRRQQQARDPGEQLDAAVPENALDHPAEPHGEIEHHDHGAQGEREAGHLCPIMDPLDEQHGGDDRARAGQQRSAQRDERHVDLLALVL